MSRLSRVHDAFGKIFIGGVEKQLARLVVLDLWSVAAIRSRGITLLPAMSRAIERRVSPLGCEGLLVPSGETLALADAFERTQELAPLVHRGHG